MTSPSDASSSVDAPQGFSAGHIRSVFARYATAMTAGDLDAVLALFSPDAVVRDPVDTPAHEGIDAIRTWFGGAVARLAAASRWFSRATYVSPAAKGPLR